MTAEGEFLPPFGWEFGYGSNFLTIDACDSLWDVFETGASPT